MGTRGSSRRGGRVSLVGLFVMVLLLWTTSPFAATLLLIRTAEEQSPSIQALERVAQAYGIRMLDRTTTPGGSLLIPSGQNIRGIVVTAKTYGSERWFAYERKIRGSEQLRRLPLLVFDIARESTSTHVSDRWPSVNILTDRRSPQCVYHVDRDAEISKELGGLEFSCSGETSEPIHYFNDLTKHRVEIIVEIAQDSRRYPIFFKASLAGRDMYFLARVPTTLARDTEIAQLIWTNFAGYAPVAMFIRRVSGEYGWHANGYYANFTVDDPWLREPYGNLSYHSILSKMEKYGFHTTIAFVPWNFDRNDPSVVRLFKENPTRLSLSVHGNNHDHEEFSEERTIDIDAKNVRQGLARMEQLKKSTGLDYDRVMVFPQRIASEQVIGLLRRYGFACTANLQNRRHESTSAPPEHIWGDFVALEQGVPSVKRELANAPKEYLAILLFLQRPLLLHAHQDYFARHDFGTVAAAINQLHPGIRWVGLGSLCDRLYLTNLEDNGTYRVLLFGGKTTLENSGGERRVFVVEKVDPLNIGFRDVRVDGKEIPITKTPTGIQFKVAIEAHSSAIIVTKFSDQQDEVAPEDTSKTDLRIRVLRYASDFRDLVVTGTDLGRRFNDAYYSGMRGRYSQIDALLLFVPLVLIGSLVIAIVVIVRLRKQRRMHERD